MKTGYPPGPKDRSFGISLARRLRDEPLEFITETCRTYGDIAFMRMGPVRVFMVNHPELIRQVLVTKAKNFRKVARQTRVLAQVDGAGLVVSEGDLWKRQRRLVQGAFQRRRLAGYAEVTVEYTRRWLDSFSDAGEVNIADQMTHLTLEIIAKTMFGAELTGLAAQLGDAVADLSDIFVREISAPIRLPDWLPLPAKRRKRRALGLLDTMIRDIIRERRASGEDRGDLLSLLLLAVDEEGDGLGMSDELARDEAITAFNAGHDTTATALAWVWYLLASHGDVQDRVSAEVRDVLGGRPATFEDVTRLTYAQQVIKESMRLYPPTWTLFAREACEDVTLGRWSVPKGSWVMMFPYVTHRDGRFFDDPERFDPERFSAERAEKIPQYAYIPFGAGPHVCIGASFATMEMTLIVATLIERFKIELSERQGAIEPEPHVAMRPKGGLRVKLTRREVTAGVKP